MTVQFVGPAGQLNVRKAAVQRTVNMYLSGPEVAGGKSPAYLESIPGLTVFSDDASDTGALLLESGGYLLLQSGGKILLE